MKNRSDKKTFRWWKIPLCLLTLAVLVVLGYVAYVVLTYSRIEDNQVLEVQGSAKEAAAVSREYTITSYNIGFGAYTPDFTFFMDGGKAGSWF